MAAAKAPTESSPQRKRIRRVAMKLFGRRGFAGTSMRDIAEASGLKAASLYAHLQAKEDLLLEALDEMGQQFIEGAEAIVATTDGAEVKLRKLFRFHLGVVERDLHAATVHFHEYRHLPRHQLKRIVAKRDAYNALFARVLQEGIEAGEFREMDLSLTTIQILSVLNYAYHWYSPRGRKTADEVAEVFADNLFGGLRRPRTRKP